MARSVLSGNFQCVLIRGYLPYFYLTTGVDDGEANRNRKSGIDLRLEWDDFEKSIAKGGSRFTYQYNQPQRNEDFKLSVYRKVHQIRSSFSRAILRKPKAPRVTHTRYICLIAKGRYLNIEKESLLSVPHLQQFFSSEYHHSTRPAWLAPIRYVVFLHSQSMNDGSIKLYRLYRAIEANDKLRNLGVRTLSIFPSGRIGITEKGMVDQLIEFGCMRALMDSLTELPQARRSLSYALGTQHGAFLTNFRLNSCRLTEHLYRHVFWIFPEFLFETLCFDKFQQYFIEFLNSFARYVNHLHTEFWARFDMKLSTHARDKVFADVDGIRQQAFDEMKHRRNLFFAVLAVIVSVFAIVVSVIMT